MQSHQCNQCLNSLAEILAERKERTRLGLSKYAAEAAEQAAEHRDKLGIAGKVKDVAGVHKRSGRKKPIRMRSSSSAFSLGPPRSMMLKPAK